MGLLPDTQICGLHASRHVRHARAVMHVGIANPRCRGKRSRRTRNPHFYASGKRPMAIAYELPTLFGDADTSSSCWTSSMGLLPDTSNCGLRMRWECRERFPATVG